MPARILTALALTLLLSAPARGAALESAFIAFHQLPDGIAGELDLAGASTGRVMPTIQAVAVTAPRPLLELYARDPRVKAVTLQRPLQWHLYSSVAQIQADNMGQSSELVVDPEGNTYERPPVDGSGVTVAVIDSGIFSAHPDFGAPGASRVIGGANFELSLAERNTGVLPAEVWDGYAEVSGVTALQDEVGHGTHCAGIIGGSGAASSGIINQGVAPGVNLVSLKIASAVNGVVEDIGFEANAVAAIDYLIRHREALGNVRVASNSWGLLAEEAQGLLGPTDFDPVREVVLAAVEAGIVMVFSAGNDGPGPETVRPIPNGMDEVITVAAACKADRGACAAGGITGFSSRGEAVDVTAPGDQILSTASPSILNPIGQALEGDYFGDSLQDELQNRAAYIRLSGTSMSAPHVAGVAALILQANPELTPAEVEAVLIASANDMHIEGDPELLPGFDLASGHGMVNARQAVLLAANPDLPQDIRIASARTGAAGGGALGGLLLILGLGILSRRRLSNN